MNRRRALLALQVTAAVTMWLNRAVADEEITPAEVAELLVDIASLFGANEHLSISLRH